MAKTKKKIKGKKTTVVKQKNGKFKVSKGTKIHASDVAGQIGSQYGLTKVKAKGIILDIFTIIATILQQDGSFSLPGFGSFKRVKVKARTVRSPQTGQSINVPAHNRVKFVSSKGLKESIN